MIVTVNMDFNKHPAIPDMAQDVTRVIREAAEGNQIQDMQIDTDSIQSNGMFGSRIVIIIISVK